MYTLKKFIRYYGPYKTVFFLDLLCAAIISLVDLAFPQILRTLTATVFTEEPSTILRPPSSHWPVPSDHVCHSEFLCVLCGLSGPYDGSKDGEGYETAAV